MQGLSGPNQELDLIGGGGAGGGEREAAHIGGVIVLHAHGTRHAALHARQAERG